MTRMEAVEWVVVEAVLVVAPALDARVVGLIGAHLVVVVVVVVVDLALVVRVDQVALVGLANRVLATQAQAALVGLGTPVRAVRAVLATLVQALGARVSLVVPVLLAALVGVQVQVDLEALVALGVIQMVLVVAVLGNKFLKVRYHIVFLPFFYNNFLLGLRRLVLYKYDCLLGLFSVYFVLSWELGSQISVKIDIFFGQVRKTKFCIIFYWSDVLRYNTEHCQIIIF